MLENIPKELQDLHQWVCAGEDKAPINARTGFPASVTSPSTWSSFSEARSAGFKHIGFVLTKNDPFVIIDLDDPFTKIKADGTPRYTPEECEKIVSRHQKIRTYCTTYEEVSQSGNGLHLIGRGAIKSGRNKDEVEVYSEARHIICTGNNHNVLPIIDIQSIVDTLYQEMAPYDTAELKQIAGLLSDDDIFEIASSASNSDKFNQLCKGEWEGDYTSQSEADLALLSMFCFYTQDNDQVRRLFRMSKLGKREKAVKNNTYLNFALKKIRAQQPPPVDVAKMEKVATGILETAAKEQAKETVVTCTPTEFPEGLIGKIATYILESATRPVPEVALGAAICLVAGICGRSYNISGSGLNQYLIVLARTGSGKEGGSSGIDALLSSLRPLVPTVDQFIGPGAFASGQALIRVLDEKPCFVSVLGEFGLTLQQLCDPRAHANQIMLKKVLLDLYSKSGSNKILRSSVYSDTEKNTNIISSPNVTIFGESTPETFYEGLDQSHISEGLIPRFSILEYKGKRPSRNPNAFHPPSETLTHELAELINVALASTQQNITSPVQILASSIIILDAFDEFADSQINISSAEVNAQLWNRAHLKSLKLAGLIAVGNNPHSPVVTDSIAQWAINFVKNDIALIMEKFNAGDIGKGETKQESDLRKAVMAYLQMDKETLRKYKVPETLIGSKIVPYAFISRRLRQRAVFKNDKRGANHAIQAMLDDCVKAEVLQALPKQQAREKYKVNTDLYMLGNQW